MHFISWKQILICIAIGTLTFEFVAQVARSTRPLSPFAILSAYPEPPGFHTDEFGFRGEINRGQTRTWAALGHSFTLNHHMAHEKNWSSLLQEKVRHEQIHILNYSAQGGFQMLSGPLNLAAARGQKFEKLFISLTLQQDEINDHLPTPEYAYSNSYQSDSAFCSWDILRKLLNDLPGSKILSLLKELRFFGQANAYGNAELEYEAKSEVGFLSFAKDLSHFENCYASGMQEKQCQQQFWNSLGTHTEKEAFDKIYLVCQREVDTACSFPKRTKVIPDFSLVKAKVYRAQIKKLLDLATPVAKSIYLVSHGMYRGSEKLHRVLAKDLPVSASIVVDHGKFRVLTTEASFERAHQNNDEIRAAARTFSDTPNVKFIDFQEFIDSYGEESWVNYNDYAHLTEPGNQSYADFLFENSKSR